MRKLITILFLFLFFSSKGQTRFYFETANATDVTPSIATWTESASAIVARMTRTETRLRTTIASTTIAINNSSSTATTCFYRAVSAALVAQTISGTVSGQFRMNLNNVTGATTQSRLKITVVDRAGTIVATLLAMTSGASNLTTTLTNRQLANGAALTSYACADGDRIVVEVGIGRSAGTTARNGVISFGNSSATDLADDNNVETTANNGWVEFSGNIVFNKGYF